MLKRDDARIGRTNMNILKITVLLVPDSTDKVTLHTDLPSPYPETVSRQPLGLMFDVESGKGLNYVRVNFPGVVTIMIDPDRDPMKYEVPNPA